MVRVAFIVEGESEVCLIDSIIFRKYVKQFNIEICDQIINAKGGQNLLFPKIDYFIAQCKKRANPDKIFILTDLENEPCYSKLKNKINNDNIDGIIICKKALEAWFLADSLAISRHFKREFNLEYPERTEEKPFNFIINYSKKIGIKEPYSKPIFTKLMLNTHKFSLERAAEHPNCPSAKYFIDKLRSVAM